MKWKQELLWVKRNDQGVALRIEEERPEGVPDDQFCEEDEPNNGKDDEKERQAGF
ncbi:hypothetical protein SAMN04487897_10956 [Paenibacillus sp. yr247]|uniref:hypothetical protein n=1 Tax=Paenibacillus sp. yr247 TaxID=1761880 RepID=UPI00088A6A25|nr:hypothetical protein [Paenibacillus sp. yr247]SDO16164.1 hypothetical protein SAMN04487897_10956 [Paenibacillus sp. yr247]